MEDLVNIDVGELIEYEDNPPYPNPPYDYQEPQSYYNAFPATNGAAYDTLTHDGFKTPYSTTMVIAIQNYRFCDWIIDSGTWYVLMGPLIIVNETKLDSGVWIYEVSSRGKSSRYYLP